jgi:DNA mismatch repair protein MutL
LRAVSFEERGIAVEGLIGPQGIDDASGRAVHLYVNGRFVRDPVLRKAVRDAYEGAIAPGRSPVVVLHVRLDSSRVDVNAHPAKIEVRFRDSRDVAEVVSAGIREALRRVPPRVERTAPPPTLPLPGISAHPGDDPRFRVEESATRFTLPHDDDFERVQNAVTPTALPLTPAASTQIPAASPRGQAHAPVAPQPPPASPPRPSTILAVVAGAFALIRRDEGVLVLDLRAARTLRARVALEAGVAGTRLLVPRRIHLAPSMAARLETWEAPLDQAGLSLAFPSPGEVVIRRVPEPLLGTVWETVLPRVAADLGLEPTSSLPSAALVTLAQGWAGPVTPDEARQLLASDLDLSSLERPLTESALARLFA